MQRQWPVLILLVSNLLFVGCTVPMASLAPTATATLTPLPAATATVIPSATFTLPPTATKAPTRTPKPTATAKPNCDADQLLKKLKTTLTYEEFSISHNLIQGTSSLNVWWVDPELDPQATGDQIEANSRLAQQHAAAVSLQLQSVDQCVEAMFTVINPIVVDKNYNGWFSAQIAPADLPDTSSPTQAQIDEAAAAFKIGFLRDQATVPLAPAPTGSCTWKSANENLHQHFAASRENVSFYLVQDYNGVNVWAQWDGPTGVFAMASLLNVILEIKCLHPAPDQVIVVIVDAQGTVGLIGILPGAGVESEDINQFEIVYER